MNSPHGPTYPGPAQPGPAQFGAPQPPGPQPPVAQPPAAQYGAAHPGAAQLPASQYGASQYGAASYGTVQAAAVPPPPSPAPAAGPFAVASRRTGFVTLVGVELRKLAGTVSDRILLVLAPLVLVGVTVLIHTGAEYASSYASAADQITPTYFTVRVGHVLLHAVLIKLIAGEWQHRSAQPTLLVQPSRARYFLAQATVVLMVWAVAATLQVVTTLLIAPPAIASTGATYLLGYRIGWVVGVCIVGSLLTILVALTVAMLVPNAAGALAIYFASVPVMLTIGGLAPKVFAWIDPSTPAAALATLAPQDGPGPVIVSLLLWAALLGLAGYRVARRDLA